MAKHNDGMKVSNLYIAQVKRKCGIELAKNFNISRSEGAKQQQCPKEKEEAIIEALKAFWNDLNKHLEIKENVRWLNLQHNQ